MAKSFLTTVSIFKIRSTVNHVILAGTFTGVQGDTWCKILAALSIVEITLAGAGLKEGCNRRKCVLIICSLTFVGSMKAPSKVFYCFPAP